MINYNHFITWEMFLNKRLLSQIYFSNRRFVRAIFFVYILFVIIYPSMASNVLIYFSQVLIATFVSYYFGLLCDIFCGILIGSDPLQLGAGSSVPCLHDFGTGYHSSMHHVLF